MRDSTDEPAAGVYSVCYVNGFQTQPGADLDAIDTLLLHDGDERVTDPGWPDEVLYDDQHPRAAQQVAELVGRALDAVRQGLPGVDLDNVDSWTRSRGLLDVDDAEALANLLVSAAHDRDLAVGQKNAAEHSERFRALFDFAVVEECAQYDECEAYTDAYGELVYAVEYTDAQDVPFEEACSSYDGRPGFVAARPRPGPRRRGRVRRAHLPLTHGTDVTRCGASGREGREQGGHRTRGRPGRPGRPPRRCRGRSGGARRPGAGRTAARGSPSTCSASRTSRPARTPARPRW